MRHQDKLKKARKMMTQREISDGVNVFDSENWKKHKEAIKRKVNLRELKSKKET